VSQRADAVIQHRVSLFVFPVTLELSKQFLEDTNQNHECGRDEDHDWSVGLNFLEALQDTGEDIEAVNDLGKLKHQSDREEVPPGVPS
jgi:hypothetical protein